MLLFFKAAICGVVLAVLLIVFGISVKFSIFFLIKNWIYPVVGIAGFIFVKRYLNRRPKHAM